MAKRRVGLSPETITKHWADGMKAAIPKMRDGVDALEVNPCELAVKQVEKLRTNWLKSIDDGTWQENLGRISLDQWKDSFKDIGLPRIAKGVEQAMPKRAEFDRYLVETLNKILPKIADMADLTIEDSIARVRALIEYMHANPFKRRR